MVDVIYADDVLMDLIRSDPAPEHPDALAVGITSAGDSLLANEALRQELDEDREDR